MTTEILEREETTVVEDTDEDEKRTHLCCLCSLRVSYCGCMLTEWIGVENIDEDKLTCKECIEMLDDPCPRCGE
jgi:hypothetical protein